MATNLPAWVEAARQLPVAFAQVREDPLVDYWVLGQLRAAATILMVASGGCTAAALAASGRVSRIHLVDPNPAQIALTLLKLRLLQTAAPQERLALLGHAPCEPAERVNRLTSELRNLCQAPALLGPATVWGPLGPDQAGRYERVFAALRDALKPHQEELTAVLQLHQPAEAAARVAPETPLGRALDEALDQVMALANLIALFGEGATRNRVEDFGRHFARRTRHVLATLPAADNPFLWQMYRGEFPPQVPHVWLRIPPLPRLPEIDWSATVMTIALRQEADTYDLVHLSNILDWLSPEEVHATLDLAATALRPGGLVLIRQLNSTLDIPALGRGFDWQSRQADAVHARDRSFFYRALHLGRKR
jgi:S-adenosylmethionine-diacylglycerol 3-amino-3-carboxypropyl transferase